MAQFAEYRNGNVQGFLHQPAAPNSAGLVLAHSAGGNAEAPLLVLVADAFTTSGFAVLRINLPFRQKRPSGPPGRGSALKDQENLREAADQLRCIGSGPIWMGGHSYGGRMASVLAVADPHMAHGLVLLSYPLHPPKSNLLRTQHFPALQTPCLFVHGDRDPFGTPEEMRAALSIIPGPTVLSIVEHAGHDLKAGAFDIPSRIIEPLRNLPDRSGPA